MYFIPKKFIVAERDVAHKNANINELSINEVKFNTSSFVKILIRRVDVYSKVKTIKPISLFSELLNV